MVQKVNNNQREFFRVDGELYLYAEPVPVGENPPADVQGFFIPSFTQAEDDIVGLSIDAFREHILHSEMEPAHKESWIKLQQILALMKRSLEAEMKGQKPKNFRKHRVNISGAGVAFPSTSSYLVGQTLRIALFFPRFPYSYVGLLGEVIKCEKKDKGYWVRTRFKDIKEKTQDEVLRFVNQCQRDNRLK